LTGIEWTRALSDFVENPEVCGIAE
jgi:hypothetical protein